MKLIHRILLSCFVYHATAFVTSPTTRQGLHHADSALRQHSWHDSDFYNSQNDVTTRPLHDKGRDAAAYHDFQEHFSASMYKRPGWNTYSPTTPIPPSVPAPRPAIQPHVYTQPPVYTQPAAQSVAQPVAQPAPVAPFSPPAPPVAQPAPTYAAAPADQGNTVMQQDAMEKRLESLEKNVEEIKLTLNYIASLLEKAQK